MAIVEQYPVVDGEGNENFDTVKHFSDKGKPIVQLETGRVYEEAIDTYPCAYHYAEVETADEVPAHEDDDIARSYS